MTTILTIDTSSPKCSVALQHGNAFLERTSEAERQSAQRVLPMISELLLQADIELPDVELIAVVAGPGSFTGVRIGVAVAQGLSMSASIPVLPLSSLALSALATISENGCERVLVSEEAREGEIYFAAYVGSKTSGVELVGSEQVARVDNLDFLPIELRTESWCLTGTGWSAQEDILQHLGCAVAGAPKIAQAGNRIISQLAQLRFGCGEQIDAMSLRPNYVKEQLDYS